MVTVDGVRAKLARADANIEELRGQVEPIVTAVNSSIACEQQANRATLLYRVATVPAVPLEVSAIMGDVLHNARSALDHLAWQLVLFDGGTPDRHTAFPIHDSPTNDKGNPRQINLNPPISNPALLKALRDVQPFHDHQLYGHDAADHPLWTLRKLNDVDKHRLLLAVVCALDVRQPAWWTADENNPRPTARFNWDPLVGGSKVARFDFGERGAPSGFKPHIALTVSLMEPGVTWLNHMSVVEGANGLVEAVRRTINWAGFGEALGEPHV